MVFLFEQPFEQSDAGQEAAPLATQLASGWQGDTLAAVGYSARSLAEATLREGWAVIGIDHFGDYDLHELAIRSVRVPDWNPDRESCHTEASINTVADAKAIVAKIASTRTPSQLDTVPILLAGGTENWPELVDALHCDPTTGHAVLGVSPSQLRALRNLDFWREASQAAEIGFPESCPASATGREPNGELSLPMIPAETPADSTWLVKSLNGAGGLQVRRTVAERNVLHVSANTDEYLQREITGRSLGVTCILSRSPRPCLILGATESLSAADWYGPTEFLFRGCWGPVPIADERQRQLLQLAEFVQSQTGLRGWLQCDFIEDAGGRLWLLEMNPRWTSGMELLSRAGKRPVAQHLTAWGMPSSPSSQVPDAVHLLQPAKDTGSLFAKAVVYAEADLRVTSELLLHWHQLPREHFCDLPSQRVCDTIILSGHPIMTVRTALPAADYNVQDLHQAKQKLLRQLTELKSQMVKLK